MHARHDRCCQGQRRREGVKRLKLCRQASPLGVKCRVVLPLINFQEHLGASRSITRQSARRHPLAVLQHQIRQSSRCLREVKGCRRGSGPGTCGVPHLYHEVRNHPVDLRTMATRSSSISSVCFITITIVTAGGIHYHVI